MATDISLLTQSPGVLLKHPHSGANYYDGEAIISHLNRCFGPAGWSWTTGEHGRIDDADEVYVVGTLTARIVVDGADGSEQVQETHHTERGWQAIARKRDGTALSIGDAFKGADTDALKRAARLFGVGLDAWSKTQHRPAQPFVRPEPTPRETERARSLVVHEPESLSASGRHDAESMYIEQLTRAQALDFRASWTSTDPRSFSDVQLRKYFDLLTKYITRQEGAA